MKKLQLLKLEVASRSEYSAREIEFHPQTTILTGENQRGKSSLLKTVFWCLGVTPKFSDKWKRADIVGKVTFSVGSSTYSCLRYKDTFLVTDLSADKTTLKASQVSRFGQFLAQMLDFELVINSRDNRPVVPPPAFFLLPFYVDQDLSWSQSWAAFLNLAQFSKWKKDVSEYHVGLYDNSYFREKTRLEELKAHREAPLLELGVLMRTVDAVRRRMPSSAIALNPTVFDADVTELVARANELAAQQEAVRAERTSVEAEITSLKQQIAVLTAVASEMNADYQFASEDEAHAIECPLCGAFYENSIGERFRIALTSERCKEFASALQDDVDALAERRAALDQKHQAYRVKSGEIDLVLSRTREEVNLRDVVLALARDSALGPLEEQLRTCNQRLEEIETSLTSAKEALAAYKDAGRRREFLAEFQLLVDRFSLKLNVPSLKVGSSFSPTVKATGSDLPRSLLAYYYAVLHMLWRHSRAARFPIVVDTYNQQDQDPDNLQRMNRFVFDERPEGAQVIVGIRSRPPEAPPDLHQIVLVDERKVLTAQQFEVTGQKLEEELQRAIRTRESR